MHTNTRPRLRFLVAGPLAGPPTGRRAPLDGAAIVASLAAASPTVEVDVGPILGAARPLRVPAAFPRLRAFARAAVITGAPELAALDRLAATLGPRDLEGVRSIVGDGRLVAELAAHLAPTSPAPQPAAELASDDDLVGQLLASHQQRRDAAAAIDAFVRAARPTAGAPPRPPAATGPDVERARQHLREAVARAADHVLEAPEIAAIERRCRALRLLLDAHARAEHITLDHLDIAPPRLASALQGLAALPPLERPDLVVVVDPVDLATAAELAAAAAELQAPVIVEVAPSALGAATLAGLGRDLADGVASPDPLAAWTALRGDPNARWLAVACNPPILGLDGEGPHARAPRGGAALALALLLDQSWQSTGTFARLGRDAGARAPAVAPAARPNGESIVLPTHELISPAEARALAMIGLTPLLGAANDDRFGASAAPVVATTDPPTNLAAQLVIGRSARFLAWARAELGDASEARLADAAALHLLPGAAGPPALVFERSGGDLTLHADYPAALTALRLAIALRAD